MCHNNSWDVVIIGAGIGGCSAGALLAGAGKRVLVLEKNQVGGRCFSVNYKGYTLDLGAHLLEDGAVTRIYEKVGKELKVGPPGERVGLWEKGEWYDVRELYKDDKAGLKKIINELSSMDWEELEKLDDVPLTDWVRQRTKSEGILNLFGNFGVLDFNIFTYDDVAASETLFLRKLALMEREMIGWSQYPIGGCISLVLPLADAIREKGGEVRTGSKVLEILIEDGAVRGVEVERSKTLPNEYPETERIEAPIVICTLPMWDVLEVLPEDEIPLWYIEKIKRLKDHPDCFFGFYAGVDKPMMGRSTNGWLEAPRTKLPGWALEPSAYDPSLAPEGKHLVTFGASVADRLDWLRDKNWLKIKFEELEADMEEIYPDLKDHCLWKKRYVVPHFALLQKPGYVGANRPDIQVPGVEGLYCVSDTFRTRGMGIDASARAAISAVERILGKKIPEFVDIFHY